jgi:regulator of nonsense transcripts 2
MLRLKGAKNLDNAQATMVDSAAFACRPTSAAALKDRQRTPLQRYVRHLVFDGLADDDATMGDIVKRLRRLPWADCEHYVARCLLKVCLRSLIISTLQACAMMRHNV